MTLGCDATASDARAKDDTTDLNALIRDLDVVDDDLPTCVLFVL